jgi:hypothetical protein
VPLAIGHYWFNVDEGVGFQGRGTAGGADYVCRYMYEYMCRLAKGGKSKKRKKISKILAGVTRSILRDTHTHFQEFARPGSSSSENKLCPVLRSAPTHPPTHTHTPTHS